MNLPATKTERSLAAQAPDSASLMEAIINAGSTPGVNVENIERMMALYERLEAKKAEQAFNAAMTEAQTAIRPIAADASNPQTKSKYASYLALDKALRPIYTKHGFSLSFDTGEGAPADYIRVLCYVAHNSGHSRTYKIDMPADGKGAKGGDVMTKTHATGSAVSYCMRYLLKMIFNISIGEDDDDGNSASSNGPITEDQRKTLEDLIERSHSDVEKFVTYMKASCVAEIRAKDFSRAVEALNLKLGAKK